MKSKMTKRIGITPFYQFIRLFYQKNTFLKLLRKMHYIKKPSSLIGLHIP